MIDAPIRRGLRTYVESIGGILTAAGCYQRRDEVIRKVIPEYKESYRCKIVLPDQLNTSAYLVVVESPRMIAPKPDSPWSLISV
jgi:NAD+ synthase